MSEGEALDHASQDLGRRVNEGTDAEQEADAPSVV